VTSQRQPWIFSAGFDVGLILGPAIVITTLVLLFQHSISIFSDFPPYLWLVLIVGVDVSHVYSTIFRTYLDRQELQKRTALYVLSPLLGWLVGFLLYQIDSLYFWRALAYLAVFHFVRQQYGFMMIYARNERHVMSQLRWIEKAAIYVATIYPLVYWHTHNREFTWFVKGDFYKLDSEIVPIISAGVYAIVLIIYSIREFLIWRATQRFNVPKNLLLAGTTFSWFFGIVIFNNDLAFTATNVIAHGIPYMALIWLYGHNQSRIQGEARNSFAWGPLRQLFQRRAWPAFVGALFILAYFEEGIWDGLVWREHESLFSLFQMMPSIRSNAVLAVLVPILALPQITHYILDAFIWRLKTEDTEWKTILFYASVKQT
jgi:hypothetical protein